MARRADKALWEPDELRVQRVETLLHMKQRRPEG